LLNPLDFGMFAVALILLTLAEVLVEQGLAHAIVQRHEIDAHHLSSAFWVTLAAGLAFALFALALAGVLADAFGQPEIAPLIRALSPVFVLMAWSSVPAALLRRELDYKLLAKRTAASNLVSGAVAICCAVLGAGVWTFVAQLLTFHLIGALVLWRYESWRPAQAISLPHLRQLAGFSGKVTLGKLLEFLETRVVDLIVGRSLGLVALGNYSLAFRANQAVTQLLAAPLWDSAIGTFARLQRDPPAMRSAYDDLSNFSSIAVVPVFVFLAVAAPHLIPALLGAQWGQSIVAFQVLALLGAVRALMFLNGSLLQATGMAGTALMLAGVRVVLSLVCLALMLRYGVLGVTLALLIGQALVVPLSFGILKSRHHIGAGAALRSLYKPLLATAAATAASTAAWALLTPASASLWAAAIGATVWLAAYVMVLALVMPRTLAGYVRRLIGPAWQRTPG
jgi:O-antigen/teichoic acid export membrane protein